jgi:hypothetical protein
MAMSDSGRRFPIPNPSPLSRILKRFSACNNPARHDNPEKCQE